MFSLRSRIERGEYVNSYGDLAHMLAMRSMIRGLDRVETAGSKADSVLNDLRMMVMARGLEPIEREEGEALRDRLAALFAQEAKPRELGALGHTLLELCDYYVRQVSIPGVELRKIRKELRIVAATCDPAMTRADQRSTINELAGLLHRRLRPYIAPEGREMFDKVIAGIWDWATKYLLRDAEL